MSEHVSVNITFACGICIGIIAHNEQFVSYYRICIPWYINKDFVTQSVKHQSEHVSLNRILLVGFVGVIAHNEQFVICYGIFIP